MNALASPSGFSSAYQAHASRAFSAAYRVLGDVAAAEDVVQDVFVTIWRDPSKFDPDRGSLAGYLAMMARSRAVDRMRSRQARDSAVERLGRRDERDVISESPDDAVLRRDESARALRALAELPAPSATRSCSPTAAACPPRSWPMRPACRSERPRAGCGSAFRRLARASPPPERWPITSMRYPRPGRPPRGLVAGCGCQGRYGRGIAGGHRPGGPGAIRTLT